MSETQSISVELSEQMSSTSSANFTLNTANISLRVNAVWIIHLAEFGIGLWNSFTNAFQRILAQQN